MQGKQAWQTRARTKYTQAWAKHTQADARNARTKGTRKQGNGPRKQQKDTRTQRALSTSALSTSNATGNLRASEQCRCTDMGKSGVAALHYGATFATEAC